MTMVVMPMVVVLGAMLLRVLLLVARRRTRLTAASACGRPGLAFGVWLTTSLLGWMLILIRRSATGIPVSGGRPRLGMPVAISVAIPPFLTRRRVGGGGGARFLGFHR
jgi:hypothetical protein